MAIDANVPLKIQNLVKNYGSHQAVGDVSFAMEPGEIFGLLGPNGAGKTSLISCLVTLQKPTSGTCEIFGVNPHVSPKKAKLSVGFVPQELINHGYFNVEEILNFHSGYYQRWNNGEKIKFLLNKVGLYEHRKKRVKTLSGGMKRRLLIAKALVHDPKLLLLDEPTAGVDIELRNSLWDFVQELRAGGMSILLTTHYLEEAEELCDRVGILQQGHLKTVGPTKELIAKLTQRRVNIAFSGVAPDIQSPYLLESKDCRLSFQLPQDVGVGEVLGALGSKVSEVKDISIDEGSLEDAFVRVLGGAS